MSLFIAALNSGSNGNCYYIGNESEAILVDAGINCRETEKRMKRLGLHLEKVKAIFISHEHADHINGTRVLSKKHRLPVYITETTEANGRLSIEKPLVARFRAFQPVRIGELCITAFPKFHDAGDPHSFIITSASVAVGVFTDIGIPCDQVTHYFRHCHAAFLEANYDEDMLRLGGYPPHLKKRISGGNGHLSNTQALKLFVDNRPPFMSHLILSHLSKNNNDPELVRKLFSKHAGNTEIVVASRYEETPLFHISGAGMPRKEMKKKKVPSKQDQLTLF
jgi:phosphoribosyl 1,2-cyclic phosphodiesterase